MGGFRRGFKGKERRMSGIAYTEPEAGRGSNDVRGWQLKSRVMAGFGAGG